MPGMADGVWEPRSDTAPSEQRDARDGQPEPIPGIEWWFRVFSS